MQFHTTEIPDILEIEPEVYRDNRGFFFETYQKELFDKAGIHFDFVQDNHSCSIKGTLRGLHYQVSHVQGKLVRVIRGKVFDVAVDLRKSSPNFGKWAGMVLSQENKKLLWIPPGFAHGFYTLSSQTEILYKTTDYYDPKGERCIIWNDPSINIIWPLNRRIPVLLSMKDKQGVNFINADVFD
jgi:dTDP-4-dehydrorhamnose 3,5-epimerase